MLDQERKGSALGRVERELADERRRRSELDELAREPGFAVGRVIVGREQVAVGGERQTDRTAKVGGILIDQSTGPVIRVGSVRVSDRKNAIVARGSDVKRVALWAKLQAAGTDDHG